MSGHIEPKSAPSIGLPKSDSTCDVAILDTSCDMTVAVDLLIEPKIDGHEWLNLPDYSFHITHKASGAQVLFDLGTRKDWYNSVPHIAELISSRVQGMKVDRDAHEILQEGGVDLSKVKAFILSHWHFDHTGNIAALPPSVDLLVGPGFKDEFVPGYPANQSSPFWEEEFKGRNVIEVPFNDGLKIGRYPAHDYFGDGSLYILEVPGHAVGHISALVRTTPDTAVFLGGDVCHFTGVIRPTEYIPLPEKLPAEAALDKRIPAQSPCSIFSCCHPNQSKSRTEPFYTVSTGPRSFYMNQPVARQSIQALIEFDADPNVLVVIAHDTAPKEVLEFFPKGTINDWQAKGAKAKMHWGFLNEMPIDGKVGKPLLVPGLFKDGKRVRGLDPENPEKEF